MKAQNLFIAINVIILIIFVALFGFAPHLLLG